MTTDRAVDTKLPLPVRNLPRSAIGRAGLLGFLVVGRRSLSWRWGSKASAPLLSMLGAVLAVSRGMMKTRP